MAKRVECPECGSDTVESKELEDKNIGGSDFLYMEVHCDNGHEYGLELEVATILN